MEDALHAFWSAAPPDELAAALAEGRPAVERALVAMRGQVYGALSLADMADAACLSPYHFSRVFRRTTGLPPGAFYAALRLEEAKRRLLTSRERVTDICFDLGYVSLGSFTSRFTALVGLTPRALRRLAGEFAAPPLAEIERTLEADGRQSGARGRLDGGGVVAGVITLAEDAGAPPTEPFAGLIFAGLFPKPIPQCAPVASTLLTRPGLFCLRDAPPGRYYILAAALPWSCDPLAYLTSHHALRVGSSGAPVTVALPPAAPVAPAVVTLRRVQVTNPPLLVFLPHLLLNSTQRTGVTTGAS